jgi:1-aminocyclopropane-1-carboxylate deaminase
VNQPEILPSPIQTLAHPLFKKHQLKVVIKRDDLIHPIISGNKWRKLKGNIAQAKDLGKKGMLSFGGAYSNHIHALSFACQQHGLKALGIIRGEPEYKSNYTLSWARYWGMRLSFVDRQTYRRRGEKDYIAELQAQYKDYFIVPEGGTNEFALSGVEELIHELNQQIDYDTLMLPVGSGGTLSGLIKADNNHHRILGVAVLKQAEYLVNEVNNLLANKSYSNWQLLTKFHRGGYAKFSNKDCQRLAEFIQITGVPFEPVYSGKMILALLDLIEQSYFPAHHRIVLLHTGGIQGLGGLIERDLIPSELVTAVQSHLPSAPPAL